MSSHKLAIATTLGPQKLCFGQIVFVTGATAKEVIFAINRLEMIGGDVI
jgi:hypothetical protein